MSKPMIQVDNISKSYILGEAEPYLALRDVVTKSLNPTNWLKKSNREMFWALKDISFSVNEGEVIGVIGHNGAGKSTLLKILSRITPPTKGKVTLNGRVASLLEVGTGFHPELTGRENIFLNGAILGMTKKEIRAKFDEIVDFAGVEQFLDTPVKKYSSGMYVRLAFAVAAHLDPEILLVDEVLAVGDVAFQKKCLGKMTEVTQESGRTILFVSHNMGAVQNLCKKTILLEQGEIKMFGDTNEAVERYVSTSNRVDSQSLEQREDRKGDGRVKLVGFDMINEHGHGMPHIQSGDTVTMRFHYKKMVPETLDNVELSLTIRSIQETNLILHKTSYKKANFSINKETGTVSCTIKNFPLIAGTYIVGSEFQVNHQQADELPVVTHVDVVIGDFFRNEQSYQARHSPVLINGEWSVS